MRSLILTLACFAATPIAATAQQPPATCEVAAPILVSEKPSGPSTNVGQLVIQPTWETTITSRPGWQAVIQQAINEWQNTITNTGCSANPLPIYFRARPLTPPTIGFCQPLVYISTGCMFADTISFDTGTAWFIDPTPANDSEFIPPAVPPAGLDLLTVARHEIGHGVGWTGTTPVNAFIYAGVFDGTRMNIPIHTASGLHVDPTWIAGDLMTPSLGAGQRRAIDLYPDGSLIARAFDGDIPMEFVDRSYGGISSGRANAPWKTLVDADAQTPLGWPILFASATYTVAPSFMTGARHLLRSARGGTTITTP